MIKVDPYAEAGQNILSASSPDGNSVTYWSYQGFGDSQSANQNSYKASRTAAGWSCHKSIPALPERSNINYQRSTS